MYTKKKKKKKYCISVERGLILWHSCAEKQDRSSPRNTLSGRDSTNYETVVLLFESKVIIVYLEMGRHRQLYLEPAPFVSL